MQLVHITSDVCEQRKRTENFQYQQCRDPHSGCMLDLPLSKVLGEGGERTMAKTYAAKNKTKPENTDVTTYLASIEHAGRREDACKLLEMMQAVTGEPPCMWGPSIIGFGRYHYVYESGREGDSFLTGFAPRKANMVVYVMPGFGDYQPLLQKLGKHKTGASCLYLGRLSGIDEKVLRRLVTDSVKHMRKKYKV
ncbi:MAG: DUF1801 domain-containing protein [Pseudomonadota bacterium]